jgi:hypothetical protein
MICVSLRLKDSRRLPATRSELRKMDTTLFAGIPGGDPIVGVRNVLAHGYATLDHRRVYDIASVRAAELQRILEKLLDQMPEDLG